MRIVNFNYINQAYRLLRDNNKYLSNKRLRRLAYLDVHQNSYKSYLLYLDYKKIIIFILTCTQQIQKLATNYRFG